jgi:hypothetical protein
LQLAKENLAAFRISKDWSTVKKVTGYIVECAWDIEVRPFASHVRKLLWEDETKFRLLVSLDEISWRRKSGDRVHLPYL